MVSELCWVSILAHQIISKQCFFLDLLESRTSKSIVHTINNGIPTFYIYRALHHFFSSYEPYKYLFNSFLPRLESPHLIECLIRGSTNNNDVRPTRFLGLRVYKNKVFNTFFKSSITVTNIYGKVSRVAYHQVPSTRC